MPRATVTATAYQLKGNKGSISFKWKSKEHLTPNNEKELIAGIEKIIGAELEKHSV